MERMGFEPIATHLQNEYSSLGTTSPLKIKKYIKYILVCFISANHCFICPIQCLSTKLVQVDSLRVSELCLNPQRMQFPFLSNRVLLFPFLITSYLFKHYKTYIRKVLHQEQMQPQIQLYN